MRIILLTKYIHMYSEFVIFDSQIWSISTSFKIKKKYFCIILYVNDKNKNLVDLTLVRTIANYV